MKTDLRVLSLSEREAAEIKKLLALNRRRIEKMEKICEAVIKISHHS